MIGPTAILEPLAPSLQATIREIAGSDFDLRFPESTEPESLRAALSGADYAVVYTDMIQCVVMIAGCL